MLYQLANKHRSTYADKSLAAQSYKMPTAYSGSESEGSENEDDEKKHKQSHRERKMALLNKRYEEDGPKRTDQEQWELDQERKTAAQFGSTRGKRDKPAGDKQYDLILGEQVDFVRTQVLEGITKAVEDQKNEKKRKKKDKEKKKMKKE